MTIRLQDSFSFRKLILFTLPSIGMMLFMSVYGVVDGLFISHYVGKTAFAAVNLVMPFTQILSGVGAMLGVGGSALVAKTLGEGEEKRAGQYFTMMMMLLFIVGLSFTALGMAVIRPVCLFMGATENMIEDCVLYGRTVLAFSLFMHMQYQFQSYLIVAEKPALGFLITLLSGAANMVLDVLCVGVWRWGVRGAAFATGVSQCIGGGVPLIWFISKKNRSALRFTKTRLEWKPVLKACGNGASEMLSSVSGSVTGMLYNIRIIGYAGEDGVAAYGAVMYASFVFISVLMGYSTGVSPVIGYHFGAGNHRELHRLLQKSLLLVTVGGCGIALFGYLLAEPISFLFAGYDQSLMHLTAHIMKISILGMAIMGVGMFTSSFFTALNDGKVS
ncbi:MAG: MATE family efflux transporter, partial [Clostridia bacterium]|nr:MATE family efflux transporter [Clostridia bacterium]